MCYIYHSLILGRHMLTTNGRSVTSSAGVSTAPSKSALNSPSCSKKTCSTNCQCTWIWWRTPLSAYLQPGLSAITLFWTAKSCTSQCRATSQCTLARSWRGSTSSKRTALLTLKSTWRLVMNDADWSRNFCKDSKWHVVCLAIWRHFLFLWDLNWA